MTLPYYGRLFQIIEDYKVSSAEMQQLEELIYADDRRSNDEAAWVDEHLFRRASSHPVVFEDATDKQRARLIASPNTRLWEEYQTSLWKNHQLKPKTPSDKIAEINKTPPKDDLPLFIAKKVDEKKFHVELNYSWKGKNFTLEVTDNIEKNIENLQKLILSSGYDDKIWISALLAAPLDSFQSLPSYDSQKLLFHLNEIYTSFNFKIRPQALEPFKPQDHAQEIFDYQDDIYKNILPLFKTIKPIHGLFYAEGLTNKDTDEIKKAFESLPSELKTFLEKNNYKIYLYEGKELLKSPHFKKHAQHVSFVDRENQTIFIVYRNIDELIKTLFHELGHAADYSVATLYDSENKYRLELNPFFQEKNYHFKERVWREERRIIDGVLNEPETLKDEFPFPSLYGSSNPEEWYAEIFYQKFMSAFCPQCTSQSIFSDTGFTDTVRQIRLSKIDPRAQSFVDESLERLKAPEKIDTQVVQEIMHLCAQVQYLLFDDPSLKVKIDPELEKKLTENKKAWADYPTVMGNLYLLFSSYKLNANVFFINDPTFKKVLHKLTKDEIYATALEAVFIQIFFLLRNSNSKTKKKLTPAVLQFFNKFRPSYKAPLIDMMRALIEGKDPSTKLLKLIEKSPLLTVQNKARLLLEIQKTIPPPENSLEF